MPTSHIYKHTQRTGQAKPLPWLATLC